MKVAIFFLLFFTVGQIMATTFISFNFKVITDFKKCFKIPFRSFFATAKNEKLHDISNKTNT